MDNLTKTISNRYAGGGLYFKGEYDKEAFDEVVKTKEKFPFKEIKTRYVPRSLQRYNLIYDEFMEYVHENVLDVGSRDDRAEKILGLPCTLIDKNNFNNTVWDWEKTTIPFPNQSFQTVLCLDTLEHVNDIHSSFADLVRVTEKYLIISLPNCWRKLLKPMLKGTAGPASYGIPPEKPQDRHKWYFNTSDAENFLFYNAAKHGFEVAAVGYHVPRVEWHHHVRYAILKVLFSEERYKNWLTETFFVVLKRK